MTKAPEKAKDGKNELTKAVYQVDHVLKGGQTLKQDESGGLLPVEAYYFGDAKVKSQFMLLGLDPPKVKWGSPLVLSAKAVEYVRKLPKLPAEGPERYRRTLYGFRKRSMPDPVMANFDGPNGDFACARRMRSNSD